MSVLWQERFPKFTRKHSRWEPKAQTERGRELGTGRRKEDIATEQDMGRRRSCSFCKRGRKDHLYVIKCEKIRGSCQYCSHCFGGQLMPVNHSNKDDQNSFTNHLYGLNLNIQSSFLPTSLPVPHRPVFPAHLKHVANQRYSGCGGRAELLNRVKSTQFAHNEQLLLGKGSVAFFFFCLRGRKGIMVMLEA